MYSQETQECVNEVSTHPNDEPSISHLNALPQDNNQPDTRFLNKWEWWYQQSQTNVIPINNMGQSSGQFYGSPMDHFNHSSQGGFYSYLSVNVREVMLPENGWELVSDNRGWYPDQETDVPMDHASGQWKAEPTLRSIPYLIFYNKYSGMARIFVRYGNNQTPINSINAVEITLVHEDLKNMTGMLRLGAGYDRTLDQNSIVTTISATVPSPGDENQWFSADFQLAYDPCVCDYESNIRAKFRFLNEGKIILNGVGASVPVNLLDPNNVLQNEFLNAYQSGEEIENGYMIYKSISALIEDYEKKLSAHKVKLDAVNIYNEKVERQLALLEIAKVVTTLGVTAVTGMPNYTSLLGKIPALYNIKKDSQVFGKEIQKVFWKELDKLFSTGFKLFTNESLKKKDIPQEPTMPTASVTEMSFSGGLSYSTPEFKGSDMKTPGSKNANNINLDQPQAYPIYNERLGVFALLEKPKLDLAYFKKKPTECDDYKTYQWTSLGSSQSFSLFDVNSENLVQFRLKEPLKYTFNPMLEIEDVEILASIEFLGTKFKKGHPDRAKTSIIDVDDHTKIYLTGNKDINVESTKYIDNTNSNQQNSNTPYTEDDLIWINSMATPIDAFSSTTYQFSYNQVFKSPDNFCEEYLFGSSPTECENPDLDKTNFYYGNDNAGYTHYNHLVMWDKMPGTVVMNDYIEYEQSEFGSCSNLTDYFDTHNETAPQLELNEDSVYLKLIINVIFKGNNNDGSPKEYTYMFTYKIDKKDISIDYNSPIDPNLVLGSSGDITQYPENLFLDGINFDGSQIDGCKLVGNTYTCKAWNDVTLSGDFIVGSSYKVFIEAGNEVIVTPEADTPPEMIWQIIPVLDYSNPMPPVDADFIDKFCSKDNDLYKAHRASDLIIKDSTNIFDDEISIDNFAFNIFPNPTSGSSTASITLNESANAELFITDMNGRTLGEALNNRTLRAGQSEHQLPTGSLTRGIYLVHLYINGERHVKKLVIQ